MFKRLIKILLGTATTSFAASIILLLLIYRSNPNTHSGGQGIVLLIIGCFYVTFILMLSSLTLFLNISKNVRFERVSRILSFFLLPIIFLIYFLLMENSELFFVINASTYLATLLFFYLKFSKTLDTDTVL